MQASASGIWCPETIWITSRSRAVVKIHTPSHVVGYSIADAKVNERYGVTVVGIKAPGSEFQYGSKDLVMHRNDELVIMGKQDNIDKFIRG